MNDYELMLLVSPQIADEDVTGVVDKVTTFVTERGGNIAEVKPWGRRRMAYNIKDFQEASYVVANFSMDPKNASELEASLNISEEVIRHLLIRASAK